MSDTPPCAHSLFQANAFLELTRDSEGPMVTISSGRRACRVKFLCTGCDSYRMAYFLTDGTMQSLGPIRNLKTRKATR